MQQSFSFERATALVLFLLAFSSTAGTLAAEEIRGRVENRDGASIEHARVAIAETNGANNDIRPAGQSFQSRCEPPYLR